MPNPRSRSKSSRTLSTSLARPPPLRSAATFCLLAVFNIRPIPMPFFLCSRYFSSGAGELPDVRFYVIGDKAPPAVIALSHRNIIITGSQPDVSFYFNTIKLSVAPLRFGAGVKGKINHSMAFGVPVVATSLAVEGMSLTESKRRPIADSSNLCHSRSSNFIARPSSGIRSHRMELRRPAALIRTQSPNTNCAASRDSPHDRTKKKCAASVQSGVARKLGLTRVDSGRFQRIGRHTFRWTG